MGFRKCIKISFTAVVATKIYDQQKYWGPLSRRANRKGGGDLPCPFLKMKKMPWFCKESFWLCLSLGSKSATDLNLLFYLCQKIDIWNQKRNWPNASSVLINTESSISFFQSVLTSESTDFFCPYFH